MSALCCSGSKTIVEALPVLKQLPWVQLAAQADSGHVLKLPDNGSYALSSPWTAAVEDSVIAVTIAGQAAADNVHYAVLDAAYAAATLKMTTGP